MEYLRGQSALPRTRSCLLNADPRGVTIGRVEGKTSFAGALACGKRACPSCGPRIAIAHRDDIAQVVHGAQARGWTVRFLTLTIRHGPQDTLGDLLDALLACWRGMTKGRWWDDLRRHHGIAGMIRVVECKHGHAHGWHPHLHVLLFIRTGCPGTIGDLYVSLLQRWATVTDAAGYAASALAQDMREVGDEHLDRLAGYLTKELDIAAEMTGGALKSRGESRTPLGLLVAAVAGDRHAADLFREFEVATAGRRLYAGASAELRRRLHAEPAPVEEEAAAQPVPIARERLARVSRGSYESLARVRGFRGDIAAVVEGGAEGYDLLWYLRDRGIHAGLAPDDAPASPGVSEYEGQVPF